MQITLTVPRCPHLFLHCVYRRSYSCHTDRSSNMSTFVYHLYRIDLIGLVVCKINLHCSCCLLSSQEMIRTQHVCQDQLA
uniref:Uncharacterized protein n=1 Tax=Pyxicephalus adspersus TaxID=30357 RepID=A0AAV3ACN2_PYXAD|nr:TPA: hypothetical protein GDO54_017540 [Pyxicephalus adspersus]